MTINTYLLEKAGIDFEHGFNRYAGCAYHFNNALLSAKGNPVFARINRPCTPENVGYLYVCANELKKIADNLGMAGVYEAASILSTLLHDKDHSGSSIATARETLDAAIKIALCGICGACA